MRLWIRIAAVMAIVSVAPLLVVGVRSTAIATREAERSSADILLRDADALATLVDTWVGDQVQALAGWMQLFPLGDQTAEQRESLQKSVFLAVPAVVTVALLDADGVPLVPPLFIVEPGPPGSTLEGRTPGSDDRASWLVERVPLTEALARRGAVATGAVGEAYRAPGALAPSVPVGVTGPFGEDIVLGAELSLDLLVGVVEERSDETHAVALLSPSGEEIAGGAHPLVDASRLLPLLGTRSSVSYALPGGGEVRGAVSPIGTTGWSVVVVEPVEVAERAALLIRQRATWMILAAMGLAVGIGVIFARTLSEPVDRLRGVALQVAEGQYGRTVDIERSDEIGDLARAFDHMSIRLRDNAKVLADQRAEIESFAAGLQERVDERTRELRDAQDRLVRSGQLAAVAEVGAGLAHELNNPLSAILGLTQVLRDKRRGTVDEAALTRIEEQAQRCRSVVAAMLRLSSGEVDPHESSVVDLRVILRDVVELVQGPFRQRGVAVALHEGDVPLRVRIHPVYGSRVLAQILGAFRAGLPEGARLDLSAVELGDEVAIDLDPDRGLAAGNARDDWMASGMGLWVARHLLDQVGGRIEEPLPGQTRWRILLPGVAG